MPQERAFASVGGNVQKVRCLTRPTQARQDAPFHGQGRSPFDARSVLSVREYAKRARTPLAAFFNIPTRRIDKRPP